MATHYLKSETSINSYRDISTNSQVSSLLTPNTQFTVLEENVGLNCSFHKIEYNNTQSYLESKYISPLSGTLPSAPFVCKTGIENSSYVEPVWYMLDETQPFFNDKTKEYCISITSNAQNIGDRSSLYATAKQKGIKKLFQYYAKDVMESDLVKYDNYYIFAEVKDIYVPFRPLAKTKILIGIKQKYFDAIPQKIAITEIESNINNANYIVSIPLASFQEEMSNIARLLNLYNKDVFMSNSKVGFNLSTSGVDFYNTSDTLMNELDLGKKAEKVIEFYERTKKLMSENGVSFLEDKSTPTKSNIEFAINDECNILYDVAINNGKTCTRLPISLNSYLSRDPIDDPTTINFIKNYKKISKIDKCDFSWVAFVEQYVYPKVIVSEFDINDISNDPSKKSYEFLKDLLKIIASINEESAGEPVKLFEEFVKSEERLYFLSSKEAFEISKKSLLDRMQYIGDNMFNPDAIEESLKKMFLIDETSNSDSKTDEEKPKSEKVEEFWLVKIYEFLNKTGICSLIDFVMSCLLNILKEFVDIQFSASINVGSLRSLSLDELLHQLVPALTKEQQTLVYRELLLKTSSMNSKSLLYCLKTTLPKEQYDALYLETATYENIVSVTAELMSTGE